MLIRMAGVGVTTVITAVGAGGLGGATQGLYPVDNDCLSCVISSTGLIAQTGGDFANSEPIPLNKVPAILLGRRQGFAPPPQHSISCLSGGGSRGYLACASVVFLPFR